MRQVGYLAVILVWYRELQGQYILQVVWQKVFCKSWDFLWDQVVVDVFGHLVDEYGQKLHANGDVPDLKGRVANFSLVSVEGILWKGSKELEKLMEFSHENHQQVHNCVFVVIHTSFGFFILNELLPGKLVEERFGLWNIHGCKLHTTHVCTSHANIFHNIDVSFSFDDGSSLPFILIVDPPVDLISFFLNSASCRFHHCAVCLWEVMKGMTQSGLVHQANF
jgi:hypothetical protein